jgi:hypothetical protein
MTPEVQPPVDPPVRSWLLYLLAVPIGLAWPVAQVLLFAGRFRAPPPGTTWSEFMVQSLVFFPMGFVTALVLLGFVHASRTRRQQIATAAGYLAASPCALVGALFSGLMMPQPLGTLLYGGIPLVVGTVIGYFVGQNLRPPPARR